MNVAEFLNEFQLEAGEKLDLIASQLLRLERDPTSSQPIREMFLAAHTIKGGAAMLRLTDVEALAHAIEDLLSAFRDQQRTLDAQAADLLFKSLDHLRGLIAVASAESVGTEPSDWVMNFASQLRANPTGATRLYEGAGMQVDRSDARQATRARRRPFADGPRASPHAVGGLRLRGRGL